jgi:hypothetical protein
VALRRLEIEGDPRLMTVLRTAYLREELRADAYGRVLREVLAALHRSGIRPLVLKGAALSETVYPERCLRHAHDIDLLVEAELVDAAAGALVAAGLVPDPAFPRSRGRALRHRTEVPILLHAQLYRTSFYRTDFEGLRARSRTLRIDGLDVITLSPADHLLHALGHASYCPGRSTLLWVLDAWMLLGDEGSPVDGTTFVEETVRSRLELPVALMVAFLRDELGAPVPVGVADELMGIAAEADPLRRDVALYGARQTRGEHPWLEADAAPGWKERLQLLRWRLFPSREYVQWAFRPRHPALVPLFYLTRPFTWAAGTLEWRMRAWWRR